MGGVLRTMAFAYRQVLGIMGVQSSRRGKPKPPNDEITQLNDSVWELYSPSSTIDMEIIFFHGLQLDGFEDAFWKTWLAKDDTELVWPQKWLPEKLLKARILSVSYNSSADGEAADMYRLGENLVSDIILDTGNIGQNCPVFLVGHSLGGIVIKQFILSAIKAQISYPTDGSYQASIDRISRFLSNFKGVFYYSTPHGGSKVANFVNQLPNRSSIVRLLETLDTKKQAQLMLKLSCLGSKHVYMSANVNNENN